MSGAARARIGPRATWALPALLAAWALLALPALPWEAGHAYAQPGEPLSEQALEERFAPATGEPLSEQALEERFARATEAMAAGELRGAAEAFIALADDAPTSRFASDALFTAARIFEDRLTEPLRALALYRRLLAEHPDSRTALAAQRRAEAMLHLLDMEPDAALSPAVGGDPGVDAAAEALARFTDLLQRFPAREESESLALAAALLADHPDWIGAPRVLLWIAGVHQRAGRLEQAHAYYLRAAEAATSSEDEDEHLMAAYRGAGEVEVARGQFAAAERYYRLMPVAGDPGRQRLLDDALASMARERLAARLHHVALAVALTIALGFVLWLRRGAGSWAAAWRALRVPPAEVIFLAPVAAVLIAATLTAHHAITLAVLVISGGGLIITWLCGASVAVVTAKRAPWRRARIAAHVAAAWVAVIALCYVAIYRNQLVDMVIETLRFGPDV